MFSKTQTADRNDNGFVNKNGEIEMTLSNSIRKYNRIKTFAVAITAVAITGLMTLTGGSVSADVNVDEAGAISPPVTEKVNAQLGSTDRMVGGVDGSENYFGNTPVQSVMSSGSTDVDGAIEVAIAALAIPQPRVIIAGVGTDALHGFDALDAYNGEAKVQPVSNGATDAAGSVQPGISSPQSDTPTPRVRVGATDFEVGIDGPDGYNGESQVQPIQVPGFTDLWADRQAAAIDIFVTPQKNVNVSGLSTDEFAGEMTAVNEYHGDAEVLPVGNGFTDSLIDG